jgi:integrase
MGREGFEQPCKSGILSRRGGTGEGTPCSRAVPSGTFGPVWSRSLLGRFDPPDGRHAVDRAVERHDRSDAGELRARGEVRLGEVDPVLLVELERSKQQSLVGDEDRREADRRPEQLGHPLTARDDRQPHRPVFPGLTQERLRTAIARAARASGTPAWSPHDLRHRRISLWHRQGETWALIGSRVGQRSLSVTADVYTHVLLDDRGLEHAVLAREISP